MPDVVSTRPPAADGSTAVGARNPVAPQTEQIWYDELCGVWKTIAGTNVLRASIVRPGTGDLGVTVLRRQSPAGRVPQGLRRTSKRHERRTHTLLISPAFRLLRCAAAAATICFLLCLPAKGQTLKGFLYDPFGAPWGDNAVGVQRHGAPGSGTMGGGTTFGTDPIGWFGFNVSSGVFSMMFAARDQYPRLYVPAVSSGGTDILVGRDPDYVTGSRDYFRNWETSFAQSFQAMGDCITHVSFRFPAGLSALVSIHEGNNPDGPQIGPARWVDGGFANDAHAMWSAGEVPTVPGQYYTAKIRRQDGSALSVCFAGGRNMNGHDFPGGKTWVGGRPPATRSDGDRLRQRRRFDDSEHDHHHEGFRVGGAVHTG